MNRVFARIARLGGQPLRHIEPPPSSGAYALIIRSKRALTLEVGHLGRFALPAGVFIYVGRAGRGLPARLARHRRKSKTVFWHIDRLTTRAGVFVEEIMVVPQKPQWECKLLRVCLECSGASAPIPRFGAGDCRAGCPAHLLHYAPGKQIEP